MKVKDTTPKNETKRGKTKKPAGLLRTATLKKVAARAGHVAVSDNAIPGIKKLYETKLTEIAPKLMAIVECAGRRTVKSKDVRFVFQTESLQGILSAA
jgi:histone H3/H4